MTKTARNTVSLEWALQSMTNEMKAAGAFATFEGLKEDVKAQELIDAVQSLANTPVVGKVSMVAEFPHTLSKFSITLDISADEEVTIDDVAFSYLSYTPALGLSPVLDAYLKSVAGLPTEGEKFMTSLEFDYSYAMAVTGESTPLAAQRKFASDMLANARS